MQLRLSEPVAWLLWLLCLSSCHSYTPKHVDIDKHLLQFRQRSELVPNAAALTRSDAREMAKMLHPESRLSRRRAGIKSVQRDNAGRWIDPQLQTNLQRILESIPYQWVATAHIGFTIPINGRLQKARELADRRFELALVQAWVTEQDVANDLDKAWVSWTAAMRRTALYAQTCDNLKQLETIAMGLVASGSLTRPGARVFTLAFYQHEAAQALARAEAQAAKIEVLSRIGLHPDADLSLQPDLLIKPFVETPAARQKAIPNSPRLMPKQLDHRVAEANLLLQVRKQWPDIQLWPGWQEEDGQPRASLGFNLPLPIFTGNDPAIAAANATRDLKAEALRSGAEQILQELATAELRNAAANEQTRRYEELLTLANDQVADNRNLASAGQLEPLLMLDALLRLHQVQDQLIEARKSAALTTIAINSLMVDPQSKAQSMGNGAVK